MYSELHSRSAFSFLEGGSLPEALASIASVAGLPAMALLDRNGFYGSPRFHMSAQKTGIRAHVGTELTVVDESAQDNGRKSESADLSGRSGLSGPSGRAALHRSAFPKIGG